MQPLLPALFLQRIFAACLMLLLLAGILSCGQQDEELYLGPEQVVRGYHESLFNNQARTDEERQTLFRHILDTYFDLAGDEDQLAMELTVNSILAATGQEDGLEVDISDMEYEILEQDGLSARVRMSGMVRTSGPDGSVSEKEVERSFTLELHDSVWKITGLN